MSDFQKPLVGWSACLGIRACRYNSTIKPNPLGPNFFNQVQILEFCPEEEAGLGTPRTPLDLYYHKSSDSTVLLEKNRLHDRSAEVQAASEGIVKRLQRAHGVVLKSRSPSCALDDAARYDEQGKPLAPGPGLLGGKIKQWGGVLAITEKELAEPWRRFIWLCGLFQLARLDQTLDLQSFHAQQETLLQGLHSLKQARALLGNKAAYRSFWIARFEEPPTWADFSARLGYTGPLEDLPQWPQAKGPSAKSLSQPFPKLLNQGR